MGNYLSEYCKADPGLDVQDIFKYLYQSCFGCEHLLADKQYVLSRITDEMKYAHDDLLPEAEMLDGDFCRVHLKKLDGGMKPETLCALFMLSAEKQTDGAENLRRKLDELLELAESGDIPFTLDEVREKVSEWEKIGFQAVRHSAQFREKYHPAYRVIKKSLYKLLPLLERIDRLPEKDTVIIGIDGRCASGKTTLAALLAGIYDCNVFHMDDYFLRPEQRTGERLRMPGENVDHERFLKEVFVPLSNGDTVHTARFDCGSMKLCPPAEYPRKRLNIVEGVYSMHPQLESYFDLKIVLGITPGAQKTRIEKRNTPPVAQRFFSEWIPMEESYYKAFPVYENADIIFEMQ